MVKRFAAADAVLVINETSVLKQGEAFCIVGRRYTGSAGKITNCRIGVFAAHVPPSTGLVAEPVIALRTIARVSRKRGFSSAGPSRTLAA